MPVNAPAHDTCAMDAAMRGRVPSPRRSWTVVVGVMILCCRVLVALGDDPAVPVPAPFTSYAQEGVLARLYRFDGDRDGVVPNLAAATHPESLAAGALPYVSRSAYGVARGAEVWLDDTQRYPQRVLGRDGRLSALRTGTAVDAIGGTGWTPDFAAGYAFAFWLRVYDGGEFVYTSGTLMNLDSGYRAGWRLEYNCARWAQEGRLALACGTAESSTTVACKPFTASVWHHVAVVAAVGRMQLYVDGALVEETTEPLVPHRTGDRQVGLRINGRWYSDAKPVDCALDELACFDRALSAAEVAALYEAGKPAAGAGGTDEDAAREASLKALTLEIPVGSWGYFAADEAIPMRFGVPEASVGMATTATYRLMTEAGEEAAAGKLALPAAPAEEQTTITVTEPGLYCLRLTMEDAADETRRAVTFPVAIGPRPWPSPAEWLGATNLALRPEPLAYGVGLNRVVCDWRLLEPRHEDYDWTPLDVMLLDPRLADLDLLVCVEGVPRWLEAESGGVLDARGAAVYRTIWRKLLARYPAVRFWQVGDAPTDRSQAAIARYRERVALASAELRAASAEHRLLVGGAGLAADLAAAILADGGGDAVDIFCLQTAPPSAASLAALPAQLEALRAACVAAGNPDLPIWNTALASAASATTDAAPASARGDAALLLQSVLLQLAGGVERVVIAPPTPAWARDLRASYADGDPSWQGLALGALRQALGRAPRLTRHDGPRPGLVVFTGSRDDDVPVVVAYSTGQSGAPVPLALAPSANITTGAATLRVRDMTGAPLPFDASTGTVQVGREPIYALGAALLSLEH